MTYNQERYIRKAFRSLLEQDYDPLEIIVSDDCSIDSTWNIIQEEADRYRDEGGRHAIILNRNDKNLGIVKNNQLLQSKVKGVLSIACAGDDISYSDRVSKVVDAWRSDGCRATIIHHCYEEIDLDGNVVRQVKIPRTAECSLGATAAYASRIFREFPPLNESVKIEDQAWAKRALMLGPELRLPDVLVRYRIGSGVSTKFSNDRERMYKNAVTMAKSCEQVLDDLEMMRSRIDPERYKLVYEMSKRLYDRCDVDWRIVSHLSMLERLKAVIKKKKQARMSRGPHNFYFEGLTYLQPWVMGEFQRRIYINFRQLLRRMKGSNG